MTTPEKALEYYKKYGSKRKAAAEMGLARTSFRRLLEKADVTPVEKTDEKSIQKDFSKDSAVITTKSCNISTLEQALEYSQVDLTIWDVERYIINSWEVTMGGNKTHSGDPETYTNYQVKVWLKRKIAEEKEQALNNIVDRLIKAPLVITNYAYKQGKEVLVVPGLVDQHFGLLAWGRETGEGDYDLKIAEDLYVGGMQKGIDAMKGYEISQFLLPIGSDFFHINSPDNLTPKGKNRLDVDSRLMKVFEVGQMSVIKAIEKARQIAPVEIKWIPGNHDPETSFYLCKVIAAYYRNDPNVVVDVSPLGRKFYNWHEVLIGMAHGDEEPHQRLPTIMADSCPQWWAKCKAKEWLVGHIHKKKEMNFIGVDSFGSTIIRFMPSLCKTDQWHYRKGYVGGTKSMEILAYDNTGLKGYFPIYQDAIGK